MSDGVRVHCPECEEGSKATTPFVARQLAKQHNLEYGHDAEVIDDE